MQGRAGDVGAQAAAHDLEDVVEGEFEAGAQFDGDLLLFGREGSGQSMGGGGAGDRASSSAAPWSR